MLFLLSPTLAQRGLPVQTRELVSTDLGPLQPLLHPPFLALPPGPWLQDRKPNMTDLLLVDGGSMWHRVNGPVGFSWKKGMYVHVWFSKQALPYSFH